MKNLPWRLSAVLILLVACDPGAPPEDLARTFPKDFRFGVATSAHQVEGGQTNSWTEYETLPLYEGWTAHPSGMATDFYNRYDDDFALAADLGMDVFRLSVEWSRIEPQKGSYSQEGIDHYLDVFKALKARKLQPSVTLHHFSEPTWWLGQSTLTAPVNDSFCADGPTDQAFCGWTNPEAPAVFATFCARMAQEYGAYVDEWMTFNEPQAHWMGSTVTGDFPPGLSVDLVGASLEDLQKFSVPTMRGILAGHAACYKALHENDLIDADGDGTPCRVGLATGTGAIRPADQSKQEDVDAARQSEWIATFLFFDAVVTGVLDSDFDMVPDEAHPEWANTIDILGLQYYAATEVIGLKINDLLWGVPCLNMDDDFLTELELASGCHAPPTQDFPLGDGENPRVFGRQHDPEGLLEVLALLHERYPNLPMVITENGFADFEYKRATSIVRHLDVCADAIEAGIPLEGYYHWSLTDNFEWGRGVGVRFGLYAVDFDGNLDRTPTAAVEPYRRIARARGIPKDLLQEALSATKKP